MNLTTTTTTTPLTLCLEYSVWRSTLILSFASCYIMWGTSMFPPPLFTCLFFGIQGWLGGRYGRIKKGWREVVFCGKNSNNVHGAMAPVDKALECIPEARACAVRSRGTALRKTWGGIGYGREEIG